jgi:hypothetical protein
MFSQSIYNGRRRIPGMGIWRKGFDSMPTYIVEREIPGASKMTEAELRDASLRSLEVLRQLGPEIQWIQSYVADDKIYCIYFSRDESLILEHSRKYGPLARIDRIQAVRWMLDPINYVQRVPEAEISSVHTG